MPALSNSVFPVPTHWTGVTCVPAPYESRVNTLFRRRPGWYSHLGTVYLGALWANYHPSEKACLVTEF